MRRRLLLAGCALAWGLTALSGAAELLLTCLWVYHGRYAADNIRAAEDAGAAGWFAMMLLPLFLLALWCAAWGTISYQKCGGRTPGGKR
ncbi:MAG: hypothetical protein Q4C45_03130 [Oscillospiraceae bacterium]|nr:hypothetical protein [Oscillospiraceae bacterium]